MNEKEANRMILAFGVLLFFLQGDNYASAPVLVDMVREFNLPIDKAVLTVACYMIPFGLFTLFFGPLADRIGKGKVLKASALLTALFSISSSLMPSFTLVCAARVFNGLFAAGVMPVTIALVGEVNSHHPAKMQAAIGKTMSLMFLGGALGPLIGGFLSNFGSWRLVYLFYGCMELILALLIFFWVKVKFVPVKQASFFRNYQDAIKTPGVLALIPMFFLVGMTVLGVFPYFGKFMEERFFLSLNQIGLLLGLFGLGSMIGGRMAPRLQGRFGSYGFLISGFIGGSALIFSRVIQDNSLLFGLCLLAFGFAFMSIQPILVARMQQSIPKFKGTAMSLASFNMATSGGLGVLFYGTVLSHWGYEMVFTIGSLFFFGATVIIWFGFNHKFKLAEVSS